MFNLNKDKDIDYAININFPHRIYFTKISNPELDDGALLYINRILSEAIKKSGHSFPLHFLDEKTERDIYFIKVGVLAAYNVILKGFGKI